MCGKRCGLCSGPDDTILSHTFWEENPEEFYCFYRDKLIVKGAKPNAAHLRLAKLEQQGKLRAVVTQNIDGLHQAAGSKTVYELHGSTLRNYCTRCGKFYDVDFIANSTGVPRCTECGGIVKPDVVLYEEGLDEEVLSGAVDAIGFHLLRLLRHPHPPQGGAGQAGVQIRLLVSPGVLSCQEGLEDFRLARMEGLCLEREGFPPRRPPEQLEVPSRNSGRMGP